MMQLLNSNTPVQKFYESTKKSSKRNKKKKTLEEKSIKSYSKDGVGGTHEVPVLQIAGYLGAIITRNVPL